MYISPSNLKAVDYYTDLIDGLLITGGDFDIDPKLYGEKTKSNKVTTKNHRTVFEFEITRRLTKNKNPTFLNLWRTTITECCNGWNINSTYS